ncbi:alpha/beta hydrolase [Pseudobacteroides cellulosolvens]|uniref:Esterase n=1 Tax=Pseudobacteroides cellulosolvens ATCC 35603 = DSM 2933 TaxID=398512 RepID=A0A0L6JHJ6_9FIRM|nr:alpha/beta hydrolase-fold protein [Pseudobacteroides cellulosolvens]KNY25185.1 esterase [Pseudobacteroides cellulosolvens ATCC 35603 = DSM 2933]
MKLSKFILSVTLFIILFGCSSENTVSINSEVVQNLINSKILDGNLNITVYLPSGYGNGQKYPVLYALHGASGSEWSWFDDLNADSCADRLISQNRIKPMIIVCTKTLNSLTLTDSSGQNRESDLFEKYVCQELVPYIDSQYDTINSSKSRYIGGVSMGGFIALQIGLHHPQIFGKVGGHSPASWIYDYSESSFDSWLYSGKSGNSSMDSVKFAREKELSDIKVFLDCGENDYGIVDDTKKIHEALIKRGINSTCIISKGDHSSEYWETNMEKYLEFYNK